MSHLEVDSTIFDGDNILAILDGNNIPIQVLTMGLGIDEVLSMRRTDTSERYFHADALRSISAITNTLAVVTESYEYEAYGGIKIKDSNNAAIQTENSENKIFFTAKPHDPDINSQLDGYRQLDSQTGSFFSEDPISVGGGTNLYAYVANNPVNWVDPRGLAKCSYNIGTGRLSCTSNNGDTTADAQMYSGYGDYKNNPAATGVANLGPVPARNYEIRKIAGKDPRDWFLDPGFLSRFVYRIKFIPFRGGFNLHLRKGASVGCITADDKEADAKLSSINDLLNSESGNNSLEVSP